MSHDLRSRLCIPTVLAVSALGTALGCGDDGTEDTGNDGPSTMSVSATADGSGTGSTTGDAGSTAATTTTAADSTGMMTGTDTGTLPDCQAYPEAGACEATENCVFIAELGGCIVDCSIIEDEATCVEELGCQWYGESCDFEPIA